MRYLSVVSMMKRAAVYGAAGVSAAVMCLASGQRAVAQAPAGSGSVPTFTKDVAPILYKNCVGCHRAGEIGPMPLVTYDDARPYAADIRDEVMAGHMPPWHADRQIGKFLNARGLSDAEKATIARWADGGAPRGDAKDLPPAPGFTEGWTIGKPDAVFSIPQDYEVPASGTVAYQYFTVPTNFTEDRFVQAIEIRPGARSVVHHVLVYSREPGASTRPPVLVPPAALGRAGGAPTPAPPTTSPAATPASGDAGARPNRLGVLIATTAPGTNAMTFRPGSALAIRAGSVLTFQIHYTANGTPTKDRSSVGMVFAKTPPADEVRPGAFINTRFVIPAGARDYRVDSSIAFAEDAHIWGLFPHTHLRGTKWEYTIVYPDGRSERILSVPAYDFNWQTYYMFAEPLAAPKGSRIEASAWYDNSPNNKSNPDPKSDVRWGEQTWEEMQYTGITYTVDSQRRATPVIRH
jgi:hypothetical protein